MQHSDETLKRLSESLKGKLAGAANPSARKVVCLNTNEVFETMLEASLKFGAQRSHIASCCTGNRLSWGIDDKGVKWSGHTMKIKSK